MENLVKSKQLPSNHVILRIRDYDGNLIDTISQEYDGTMENMMKRMGNLQSQLNWMEDASGINSQNFATDKNGLLKWVIAPNCLSVGEIGTKEARYILGDLLARA